MRTLARSAAAIAAATAISCGPRHDAAARVVKPPLVDGDFRFYSVDQGLPPDVRDASADEAGNVYVAAVTAVLAKRRDDRDFQAFDPGTIGITRNCDEAKTVACPLVSIAGAAPGVAYVGL